MLLTPSLILFNRTIQSAINISNMPGINSTTAYGDETVKGPLDKEYKPSAPLHTSKDEMQLVLQSFRLLIVDLCEQFGMGKFYRLWFLTYS
jgi:hypothetical protein